MAELRLNRMLKKKFVEQGAVSGVAGWEAPSMSWGVPQGLGQQHYWGFYVVMLSHKLGVIVESAPVLRQ